ncbi:MAG TPA: oxygenase MpaB family protein [Microbacteriaceae bacterium]|nr:oxygenase MpaB family protein [Microbacteriaceae bacterium]
MSIKTPEPADAQSVINAPGCPVMHGTGEIPTSNLANHDGYFAPDSVSWRVFADPSSKLGGAAAILLQSLNPMMMRVFNAASSYTEDVDGRAERTGRYIDTTVYGDRDHADAAASAVRKLHEASTWTDPKTGEVLRADNEEWLAWTHNSLIYGVLRAADAFGPELTTHEQDQFLQEQFESAYMVGIKDKEMLPGTRKELDEYIYKNREWMALTLPAAEISSGLRKPNLRGNPVKVWVSVNVQDGILSLLPDWALLLFGIEGRPMNLRAAAKFTRGIISQARKKKTTNEMISEVTSRVQTHPYRRIRKH